MIMLLLISFVSILPYAFSDDSNISDSKRWCIIHKQKCKVVVGENWGTLSETLQTEWINRQCDQYFCQFNAKFGKGIFKCNHLEEEQINDAGLDMKEKNTYEQRKGAEEKVASYALRSHSKIMKNGLTLEQAHNIQGVSNGGQDKAMWI